MKLIYKYLALLWILFLAFFMKPELILNEGVKWYIDTLLITGYGASIVSVFIIGLVFLGYSIKNNNNAILIISIIIGLFSSVYISKLSASYRLFNSIINTGGDILFQPFFYNYINANIMYIIRESLVLFFFIVLIFGILNIYKTHNKANQRGSK